MCTYSMIADYGRQRIWPDIYQWPVPGSLGWEAEKIRIEKFMEVLEAAKALDTAAGQPDCEDPKKVEFVENLQTRLEAVERELKAMKGKPIRKPTKKTTKTKKK